MEDSVAGYIAAWQPASAPAPAADFARQAAAAAGPGSRDRAKALLWAASALASWAVPLGMDISPQVLLHPSVIERFAAHAEGLTPVARRTMRASLRFLGRKIVPHLHPADEPLPRERAKKPYTPAEIDGYLALAAAQPTAARRMRAAALVCLAAGAGLIRGDLRQARGTDVAARAGGVLVDIRGARPRAVPVLARYHAPLLAAAQFAGPGLLTGGTSPSRRNVTSPITAALAGGNGLPPLDTSRLRATWLADTAALIGLPAFLRAAGISCSQRLGDIAACLDPGTEEHAVALLGGSPT